jgi:hypothetical protein
VQGLPLAPAELAAALVQPSGAVAPASTMFLTTFDVDAPQLEHALQRALELAA